MPKRIAVDKQTKQAMKNLGKLIRNYRKQKENMSQSQLAKAIELPPSNLCYIEDGKQAPTAEVYAKIIDILSPEKSVRERMDKLYLKIRKIPPPDICERFNRNPELITILQNLPNELTAEQLEEFREWVVPFADRSKKG